MNKKYFLLTFFIILFIFSFNKFLEWTNDLDNNKKIKNMISESLIINTSESKYESLVNMPEDKNDSYWNYVNSSFLEVDFKSLLETNNETVGYIKLDGTSIDYPVVKSTDNKYYLNHSFDKSENYAGWIFLDYRNNLDDDNYNTIIYGHRMNNDTMFGSLKNLLTEEWFNNINNRIIKISTPNKNSIWQIFSVYKIHNETYYLKTFFDGNDEYKEYLDKIKKRSVFDFNTLVNTNDRILTLSSCYNSNGIRLVVHAKLIKLEER